jgi:hypothetical protein
LALRPPTNTTTTDTQTPGGERQFGRKAQLSNITAAKTVADIIRSCLGPKAMLKMLLDPMGGIVLTNDGHAILREIEVAHPAAKSMIELSRTQDEEVGDGTTTVIILGMDRHDCRIPKSDHAQLERYSHRLCRSSNATSTLSSSSKLSRRPWPMRSRSSTRSRLRWT